MNEFKRFAEYAAIESGKIIAGYFRTRVTVDTKKDDSPVTIADKKAEELIRSLITKEFPDHGIIGEEFGTTNPDAEYAWVLDPIDGTKSFICGAVSFGTLIALTHKKNAILGLFHQPVLREMLIGDNSGTELNGVQVHVRECSVLDQAVLLTTDHLDVEKYQDADRFHKLIKKVKLYRNWGDCYGYYLLATGFADIMIDPIMNLWDTCALVPIIRGAGGIITDYHGNDPLEGNSVVAASPEIHAGVIRMLNE